jgi:3',5'-cyclic AMP phosphodiesterase CpdA
MTNLIDTDDSNDGIDRRGFLKCMAWAGAGVIWTLSGGILKSFALGDEGAMHPHDFSFAQISDSHIGFKKDPNQNVAETMQEALRRIDHLHGRRDFLIHTGDLSHLSQDDEFDTVDQIIRGGRTPQCFYVPGEHDVTSDGGKAYLARFGQGLQGAGWYSFDHKGVHFVALVNVVNLEAGGLGQLGQDQLTWLQNDLSGLGTSTPIVVFAHIPLWSVYPAWGWGTADAAVALGYLQRFGSVTILNGHIHQIMQKVEGNVTFHTAMSTAFPQPAPGTAPKPGPMAVAPGVLRSVLGITDVRFRAHGGMLALTDYELAKPAKPVSATDSPNPVAALIGIGEQG